MIAKIQAIREHIALREQFWEIRYSTVHWVYGFVSCLFHDQAIIESASATIRMWIKDYGTISNMRRLLKY